MTYMLLFLFEDVKVSSSTDLNCQCRHGPLSECQSLPVHMSLPQVFSGVRAAQSILFVCSVL
jgi:hypothetical protein